MLKLILELLMLKLILICNEYFCLTKTTRARNIQTVFNIKSKPWLKISVPEFGFLVLGLRSWVVGARSRLARF